MRLVLGKNHRYFHVTSAEKARSILKRGFSHRNPSQISDHDDRFEDDYEWFNYYHDFVPALPPGDWKRIKPRLHALEGDNEEEEAGKYFRGEWKKIFGDKWTIMWVCKDNICAYGDTVLEYIPDAKDFVTQDVHNYYTVLRLEKTIPARNFKLLGRLSGEVKHEGTPIGEVEIVPPKTGLVAAKGEPVTAPEEADAEQLDDAEDVPLRSPYEHRDDVHPVTDGTYPTEYNADKLMFQASVFMPTARDVVAVAATLHNEKVRDQLLAMVIEDDAWLGEVCAALRGDGFDRSLLKKEDLADALGFAADAQEKIERYEIEPVKEVNPRDYLDVSGYTSEKPGWLLKYPESEWAKELKYEYSRDFDHILKQWRDNKLPPAIIIRGDVADGRGRTLLQYALGRKVPAWEVVPK